MKLWTTYTTVALAALAVSLVGCEDDSPSTPGEASLRVAHFAPEIPNVDICIDGVAAIEDLAYGEASDLATVPSGTYAVAVATVGGCPVPTPFTSVKQGDGGTGGDGAGGAGGDTGDGGTGGDGGGGDIVLGPVNVTLANGDSITVVAYRSGEAEPEPPIGLFTFDNSTSGLDSGLARVFVGHGADDDALDPVDVVVVPTPAPTAAEKQTGGTGGDGGAGGVGGSTGGSGGDGGAGGGAGGDGGAGGGAGSVCTVLIDDFAFGTTTPPPTIELPAGSVDLALTPDSNVDCPTEGVTVPLTADVVSIVVAVDEDTTAGLSPELWALVGTDGDPVRLINSEAGPAE